MSTLHAKIVNQGPFTKAEANVLCLMCEGCFSKEIAARLCRSPRTVDKHRENIARKLDAHSTSEIVLIASKMGWVDIRIEPTWSATLKSLLLCLICFLFL